MNTGKIEGKEKELKTVQANMNPGKTEETRKK